MRRKLLKLLLQLLTSCVLFSWVSADKINSPNETPSLTDMQSSATSSKLLKRGAMLGEDGSFFATNNRPNYYPSSEYSPNRMNYPNNGYYNGGGSYFSSGNPNDGYLGGRYPDGGYPRIGYPGSYSRNNYYGNGYYSGSRSSSALAAYLYLILIVFVWKIHC